MAFSLCLVNKKQKSQKTLRRVPFLSFPCLALPCIAHRSVKPCLPGAHRISGLACATSHALPGNCARSASRENGRLSLAHRAVRQCLGWNGSHRQRGRQWAGSDKKIIRSFELRSPVAPRAHAYTQKWHRRGGLCSDGDDDDKDDLRVEVDSPRQEDLRARNR